MPTERLKLTAIPVADLARLLQNAGSSKATVEQIESDFAAGAPGLTDGKVNLPEYAAWIVKQERRNGDDD